MKSVDYPCFACGGDKSDDVAAKCSKCGELFDVLPALLQAKFGSYRPISQLGRGYYGMVLLAENAIGKQFALKVCPAALYDQQRKSFTAEIRNYIAVGHHPNIAELVDAGEGSVTIGGKNIPVNYLVTMYVQGAITLEDFVAEGRFTLDDVIGISRQLCSAISRVQDKGLAHNDLHGRNVLLAPRSSDVLDHHPAAGTFEVKVVDFGSTVFTRPGAAKETNDLQMIGRHLDSMLKMLRQANSYRSKSEQWLLEQLPVAVAQATELDPGRRPENASKLADCIEELWKKSVARGAWQPVKLTSAFGYTNANSFPDDSYVAALFSDHFPWLEHIGHAELPILLTGPRGCGKTMILRSLRLRSVISKIKDEDTAEQRRARFDKAVTVGFFVSAKLTFGLYRGTGDNPAWLQLPLGQEPDRFRQSTTQPFQWRGKSHLRIRRTNSAESGATAKHLPQCC